MTKEPRGGASTPGRTMQSDYMHWAKFQPPVRYPLTGSEVEHVHFDRLGLSLDDLELDGASHPRYPPLREAIARHCGVATERVVAADGTAMANFLALATLVAPGDEVLIERPAYDPLVGAASFLGAAVRRFERNPKDGFRLDPARIEATATQNTRVIVLTNLHNPSSALASEDELRSVGEIAERVGARVLVDEVYLDSAVPRQPSAARLGDVFVTTSSLTKVYGLSGLRCGWILADPALAERMWRLNDLFGVNQAHQAERLACIAFAQLEPVTGDTRALLERNRIAFNIFVAGRTDLDSSPAEHGITAFPRWAGGDTRRLDELLRGRFDTAVVPGCWFEMPEHFRVGFALPAADFAEALNRLGQALDQLS
ncbi:MAG: pyridoxal phosphate-dependent aminotransferase [Sphingomicrobium sp.]